MQAKLTRLVWTTNFDTMLADSCAKVYGTTGSLTSVALDAPELAEQAISEERWPVDVKLHGDFHSRRLKNTTEELRHQDTRLRKLLVDSCKRYGLVVAGYSGRDDSVMDTLNDALNNTGTFPPGLFWLHYGEDQPLPRVRDLLANAHKEGIEVGVVRIDNFDEVLRDLIRQMDCIDTTTLDAFASETSTLDSSTDCNREDRLAGCAFQRLTRNSSARAYVDGSSVRSVEQPKCVSQ